MSDLCQHQQPRSTQVRVITSLMLEFVHSRASGNLHHQLRDLVRVRASVALRLTACFAGGGGKRQAFDPVGEASQVGFIYL